MSYYTEESESLRYEIRRLGTFVSWPEKYSSRPLVLAEAGFYYTGKDGSDKVTCFFCNMSLDNWAGNKDPIEEHRKLSPSCCCVNPGADSTSSNIPLAPPDMSLQRALAHAKQLSGASDATEDKRENIANEEICQNTSPQASASSPQRQSTPPQGAAAAGMVSSTGEKRTVAEIIKSVPPTHKLSQYRRDENSTDPRKRTDFAFMDKMRNETERRRTFYDWPDGAWQTPEALAAGGFFYTGTSDRCQCAFCRGILRNWEQNDSVMDEHRLHFGECPFIRGRNVGNIPVPPRPEAPGMEDSRDAQEAAGAAATIAPSSPKRPFSGGSTWASTQVSFVILLTFTVQEMYL